MTKHTVWVYIQSEANLWTVGFYSPNGKWHPDYDWHTKDEAAERVHYLNGGSHRYSPRLLGALKAMLREHGPIPEGLYDHGRCECIACSNAREAIRHAEESE